MNYFTSDTIVMPYPGLTMDHLGMHVMPRVVSEWSPALQAWDDRYHLRGYEYVRRGEVEEGDIPCGSICWARYRHTHDSHCLRFQFGREDNFRGRQWMIQGNRTFDKCTNPACHYYGYQALVAHLMPDALM